MSETIRIKKKNPLKGEDGNRVISIRIKEEALSKLDALAAQSNRSRNELINILLEDGLRRAVIEE